MMKINNRQIDKLVLAAFEEDIGTGDITTNTTIPSGTLASGRFIAKEDGVICGIDVATRIFELTDKTIRFRPFFKDGDKVSKGDIIAEIYGPAAGILLAERIVLNLMQRMSGISTQTAKAVAQVVGTNSKIADTRKTMPLLRVFDKYAVRVGGGSNHRIH